MTTSKKKILIVEDDGRYSHIYEILLKRAGYETDTASSKEEFQTKLKDNLDLLLVDLDIEGESVLFVLRDQNTKKIKTLAITNLNQEPQKDWENFGIVDSLPQLKFTFDELVSKVKQYI